MPASFVRQTTGTSTSITIPAAAAGNTLIACIHSYRGAGARTVSSIATTNVTWTKIASLLHSGSTTEVTIWRGVVGASASGTTVTLTMSGTAWTLSVNIAEYSGVQTGSDAVVVDATAATNQATGAAANSSAPTGAYSTVTTGTLVLACYGQIFSNTVPAATPSGYTALTWIAGSTNGGISGAYLTGAASGSKSATWTLPNVASLSWATLIVALKEANTTPSGSLSQTLGAATVSAAGVLPIVGQSARTLDAATVSSAGKLPIVGGLSGTLDAATISATGGVPLSPISGALGVTLADASVGSASVLLIKGQSARTLDAATVAGTGALPVSGSVSRTLDAVTVSSAGKLPIVGTSARTLDGATLAATGGLSSPINGTLGVTLASASASATGALSTGGTLSGTLDAATVSASGSLALRGDLSRTLDAATVTATGGGAAPVLGSLAVTLENATAAATGRNPISAAGTILLADAVLSGAAALSITGGLGGTLEDAFVSATGFEPAPIEPLPQLDLTRALTVSADDGAARGLTVQALPVGVLGVSHPVGSHKLSLHPADSRGLTAAVEPASLGKLSTQ